MKNTHTRLELHWNVYRCVVLILAPYVTLHVHSSYTARSRYIGMALWCGVSANHF
jgi:hypothetical protein